MSSEILSPGRALQLHEPHAANCICGLCSGLLADGSLYVVPPNKGETCSYCGINPRNKGDRCCGSRKCQEQAGEVRT